jgi:hypothetical protein
VLHQEDRRVGEIVDIEELAPRLAGASDLDRRGAIALGTMDLEIREGDRAVGLDDIGATTSTP